MQRHRVAAVVIFPLLLLVRVPCAADEVHQSLGVRRMEERLARRAQKVADWRVEAAWQVGLAVTVGLLGLAAGILQGWTEKKWTKGMTITAGFAVSAITLFTNSVYPADYRTLRRSVAQGEAIIEQLQDLAAKAEQAQNDEDR